MISKANNRVFANPPFFWDTLYIWELGTKVQPLSDFYFDKAHTAMDIFR